MEYRSKFLFLGSFLLGGLTLWYWTQSNKNKKKKVKFLHHIISSFHLSNQDLKKIISVMRFHMDQGLANNQVSTLKMIPSFVPMPTGKEKGLFYSLDLGGTNFRIIRLELKGNRTIGESKKQQYIIPKEAMKGTAEQLFDFIAECVKSFAEENEQQNFEEIPLGFTFSFPVEQTGINAGKLIHWTKGFSTQGVEGKDVVELLSSAFERKQVKVKVVALINDTVGTMVARAYQDSMCKMGVILGTGTNACYIEHPQNIIKAKDQFNQDIIINMEWGGFSSHGSNLVPRTPYDKKVDEQSINPGSQIFEKMISGMYLGEIVRQAILDLIEKGEIFSTTGPSEFHLDSASLSTILGDSTPNLEMVDHILRKLNSNLESTLQDRTLLKEVCAAVSLRAAKLSAAALIAVLGKIGALQNSSVAIDGSVFEHVPGFKKNMEDTIKEIDPSSSIELVLSKDGSGVGASIIAAIASSQK